MDVIASCCDWKGKGKKSRQRHPLWSDFLPLWSSSELPNKRGRFLTTRCHCHCHLSPLLYHTVDCRAPLMNPQQSAVCPPNGSQCQCHLSITVVVSVSCMLSRFGRDCDWGNFVKTFFDLSLSLCLLSASAV